MYNIGDFIRVALLKIVEGRLNPAEFEEFSNWLKKGDVPKYYFDELLNLKAVAEDLRTISEQWGRPFNEKHLAALTYAYDAQQITKIINEKFPDYETFHQWKAAEIDYNAVGVLAGD
jgi:hypothetical protein